MSTADTAKLIERLREEAELHSVQPDYPNAGEEHESRDLLLEAAAALERQQADFDLRSDHTLRTLAATHERAERAEKALEEAQRDAQRLRKLIPGCDCINPSQCWEPCGTLGHSAAFAAIDAAMKGDA